MILKPGFVYTFFRVDRIRFLAERKTDINIQYPYVGEILSDTWGDGEEPKDRLLWDEDANSADFWAYSDIYPELVSFVNASIDEDFTMHICESEKSGSLRYDYEIKEKDNVIKLEDLVKELDVDSQFIMSHHYAQYFAYQHYRGVEKNRMQGKPALGDKEWQNGDRYLMVMFETHRDGHNDLEMKHISHRHLDNLHEDYLFARYCHNVPVFRRR